MKSFYTAVVAALGVAVALPAGAQVTQTPAQVDDNHAVITGCVIQAVPGEPRPRSLLAWSSANVTLRGATAQSGLPPEEEAAPGAEPEPFVYWLQSDQALADHLGEQVEVSGTLSDFAEGDVTVSSVGETTEILLFVGDQEELAQVPTAWLGPSALASAETETDRQYKIAVRRIDVDTISVLGPCDPA